MKIQTYITEDSIHKIFSSSTSHWGVFYWRNPAGESTE